MYNVMKEKEMQTFNGSMKYDMHGRKRKTNAWKTTPKRAKTEFKPLESKKFTVAPAYNKGAYQVISRSDVKHIGK